MPIDVLMPQLSPTMEEGRLAAWKVKEGDAVKVGQVLAEVETDKATMEVEAVEDGIVHSILGKAGSDVKVGEPIAVLREEDEEVAKDYQPKSEAVSAPVAQEENDEDGEDKPKKATPAASANMVAAPVNLSPDLPAVSVQPQTTGRVSISPLAKKLAEKEGVDISLVSGTGPRGRITQKDIKALLGGAVAIGRKGDSKENHNPMRKSIAGRLQQSKQQVPHFYLTVSVNMDELMKTRKQLNAKYEGQTKLTVNDFIIKACGLALAKNPLANCSFYDDAVVYYGNADVSVAVALENGLITPIVQSADRKTMPQLSADMKELAVKAKEGELKPEQYEGGGFTISNLGMYGIKEFKAIVNPPQGSILAVGAAEKRAVVGEDGALGVATQMDISLSADHRCIDGALGAQFLSSIKFFLENPMAMLA